MSEACECCSYINILVFRVNKVSSPLHLLCFSCSDMFCLSPALTLVRPIFNSLAALDISDVARMVHTTTIAACEFIHFDDIIVFVVSADTIHYCNRQLTNLFSGNEVRGKVAIPVVQMTVMFTCLLSRWPQKSFSSTVSSGLGPESFQCSRVICRSSVRLSKSDRTILRGRKAALFDRKGQRTGKSSIEWPVLYLCTAVYCSYKKRKKEKEKKLCMCIKSSVSLV